MSDLIIPSKETCKKILQKYNTPANVIRHCLLVTEIAEEFCKKIKQVDGKLVIAGAIKHAIEGVKILEKEGLDPRIITIVKRHVGTGITAEEAVNLGLPIEDYTPVTNEEVIVSYSDNLVCGERRCSFEEILEQFIKKFGKDSHVVKGFYKQKEMIEKMIISSKKE